MMKKIFVGIFVALASLATLVSCEKTASVSVTITDVSVESATLNFTANAVNAVSLYYEVEADEVLIASETVALDAENQVKSLSVPIENNKAAFKIRATVTSAEGEKAAVEYNVDAAVDTLQYFFKKVSVLQFTGTWCNNCPMMKRSLNTFTEKFPGRISILECHLNDKFSNRSANLLSTKFKVTGIPVAVLDYNITSNQVYSQIVSKVKAEVNNSPATTDIKLAAVLEGENINVTANLKNLVAGAEYRFACALTENDIPASGIGVVGGKCSHVLREFFTNELGQPFTDAEGTEFTKLPTDVETTVTVSGKFNKKWNAENCSIVFLIFKYNAEEDKWFVDNSNVVELGGTAAYLGPEDGME